MGNCRIRCHRWNALHRLVYVNDLVERPPFRFAHAFIFIRVVVLLVVGTARFGGRSHQRGVESYVNSSD